MMLENLLYIQLQALTDLYSLNHVTTSLVILVVFSKDLSQTELIFILFLYFISLQGNFDISFNDDLPLY